VIYQGASGSAVASDSNLHVAYTLEGVFTLHKGSLGIYNF
jgi:hypothetical protein